jgi:polyhydroxyalkanoate synthesis regulator phasin
MYRRKVLLRIIYSGELPSLVEEGYKVAKERDIIKTGEELIKVYKKCFKFKISEEVFLMTNLFEKSINFGLGLFVYSREKLEEMVEELVDKGEISKKDARQFANELVKRGEQQRDEFKSLIKGEIMEVLNEMNIAKKQDIVTKYEISQIVREQVIQVLKEYGISKNENLE